MIIVYIYGKNICDAPAKFIGHLFGIPSQYSVSLQLPSLFSGLGIVSCSFSPAVFRTSDVTAFNFSPMRLYARTAHINNNYTIYDIIMYYLHFTG